MYRQQGILVLTESAIFLHKMIIVMICYTDERNEVRKRVKARYIESRSPDSAFQADEITARSRYTIGEPTKEYKHARLGTKLYLHDTI